MEKNVNDDIIEINNMKIKLVKYYVDKKTRKVIIKKYKEDDNSEPEDNDKVYIIATK